jgi:hypothetical protein
MKPWSSHGDLDLARLPTVMISELRRPLNRSAEILLESPLSGELDLDDLEDAL